MTLAASEPTTETREVERWRQDVCEGFGYEPEIAALLAQARTESGGYLVDVRRLERLLANGCSLDVAREIVL